MSEYRESNRTGAHARAVGRHEVCGTYGRCGRIRRAIRIVSSLAQTRSRGRVSRCHDQLLALARRLQGQSVSGASLQYLQRRHEQVRLMRQFEASGASATAAPEFEQLHRLLLRSHFR